MTKAHWDHESQNSAEGGQNPVPHYGTARTPAHFFCVGGSSCLRITVSFLFTQSFWTAAHSEYLQPNPQDRPAWLSHPSAAWPQASDHSHLDGHTGPSKGPRQQVRKGCPPQGIVQQTPAVRPTSCPHPSCLVPPPPTLGKWPGLSTPALWLAKPAAGEEHGMDRPCF